MKLTKRIAFFTPFFYAIFAATNAHAQTRNLHWDNNGGTTGFGIAGGTWTATTANQWNFDATAVAAPQASVTSSNITDSIIFGTNTIGLAAGTINVSGTVDSANQTFGSQSGAITLMGGNINLNAAHTVTVNNATNTINSVLTGASSSYNKVGTGTLILSGANTYTGATNVNGGTLEITTGGSLTNSAVTLTNAGSTFTLSGGTVTTGTSTGVDSNYVINAGGITNITSGILNIGNSAGASNGQTYIGVGTGTGTMNINGGTVNVGIGSSALNNRALWVGVNGNGVLNLNGGTLSSARDIGHYGSNSGTVNFDGGTLQVASNYTYINSPFVIGVTAIVKAGGAKIDTNGKNVAIGVELTHDSGLGGTADGGLTKSGLGVLTLSEANTYTGVTNIDGGTLKLSGTNAVAIISTSGKINVNNGSKLTFGAYNQLGTNTSATAQVIVKSGGVVESSGTVTGFNNLTLAGGNLSSNGGFYAGNWGSFNLFGTLSVTADSSILNTSGSFNNLSPGASNGNQTLTINVSTGAKLTNNLPIINYDGSHVYSVTKSGAGTAIFSGANTYTGVTNIDGGILKLNQAGNPVTVLSGAINVNNGGTLTFGSYNQFGTTPTAAVTVNTGGVIDSSGTVNTFKNLTLAGGNLSSTGGFAAPWGSFALLGNLNVTADSSILNTSGTGNAITPGAYNGNQTLTINVTTGAMLTNNLPIKDYDGTHVYSITKSGAGTASFNGSSTYTGATIVSAGTLLVNGALGNTAVTVSAEGTIGGTGSIDGAVAFDGAAKLFVADITDALAVASATFGVGFGLDNLIGWDYTSALNGTYTVLTGNVNTTNLDNLGIANAVTFSGDRMAYFQSGSLQVVVIPEPSAALLGGLGLLALLRRRRA